MYTKKSASEASFRGQKDAQMEVNDDFEQESTLSYAELGSVEDENKTKHSGDEGSDSETEIDQENENILRCKACGKIYRSKSWFFKHQSKCDGKRKAKTSVKLSEHQIKTRQVLSNLGVDEFFENEGLPTVKKLLQDMCDIPLETTLLRGKRFGEMKCQAEKILVQIEKEPNSIAVHFLHISVTQKLWNIVFALDSRQKTATRQKYVARYLNEYRSSEELLSAWKAVLVTYNLHSAGGCYYKK